MFAHIVVYIGVSFIVYIINNKVCSDSIYMPCRCENFKLLKSILLFICLVSIVVYISVYIIVYNII